MRAAGFDNRAIHDATQVASSFTSINRVADALHVEQETCVRAWGEGGAATERSP